jgi:hypothetical protein
MNRRASFAIGLVLLAGCSAAPPATTFGEVPRDGRGRPVWSEVMRKAAAYREAQQEAPAELAPPALPRLAGSSAAPLPPQLAAAR